MYSSETENYMWSVNVSVVRDLKNMYELYILLVVDGVKSVNLY